MEGERFLCPNCGMPVSPGEINFKTRRAHCDFCDRDIIFPKRNSSASPSAVHALNEAKRFFIEKNFVSAKSCAETAVSMVPDNMCALYVIAYYNAFVASVKRRDSYDSLFKEKLPDAVFEIEEEEMFKELLVKTVLHSCDYEEQIVCKFAEFDDPKELGGFIDVFCPFTISKRATYSWLTPNLADAYAQIAARASIPKTCYALLMSVAKNPDSPLATGQFFLKTKAQNFYQNYLLPIGNILDRIRDGEIKQKFAGVFNKMKADYEEKMNG